MTAGPASQLQDRAPGGAAAVTLQEVPGARSGRSRARCADEDPEIFFPVTNDEVAAAKAVCAACEVRLACLAFALAAGEDFGVWGGQDEDERRALRRRRASRDGSP